jgi:hypothetical protein
MDVTGLPFLASGLALIRYTPFTIPIAMTLDAYLRYAMSETRIALAMQRGASESSILEWCRATLAPVFGADPGDVLFTGYTALVRPAR